MEETCDVRYLRREDTEREIANFSKWWEEQIYQFGIKVKYYQAAYDTNIDEPIYAEDFNKAYERPKEIVLGVHITNDASMLSKFGIVSDSDMYVYAHRNTFSKIFGRTAEPNSGDVIELIEVGVDRKSPRGAPKYQITDRDDDDFPAGINPLMAHFLWYLKLKRFEASHEPTIKPEPGTGVVDDGSIVDAESDEFQGQEKFGHKQYEEADTSIYGNF